MTNLLKMQLGKLEQIIFCGQKNFLKLSYGTSNIKVVKSFNSLFEVEEKGVVKVFDAFYLLKRKIIN